ncbi:hypothetical protein OCU04_011352 [Sclerotinia nivalis]|uniref:Uncharacterized protein n=1 Tax=Sclerotinia nivalis TaxID=352851 RepID=A0A9X0DEC9_9HELO|nr:hypothetical protein OCU04_011352 [Sclerotinia nivalis]
MQVDKTHTICTYFSVTMPFIQDSHLPLSSFVKTHIDIPDYLDPSLSPYTIMNGGPQTNGEVYRQASVGTFSTSEALELARESEEAAEDPIIVGILEVAINNIWIKIQQQPTSYVMTSEEFAVFNYFQNRFRGQELATEARKRYWDSQHS